MSSERLRRTLECRSCPLVVQMLILSKIDRCVSEKSHTKKGTVVFALKFLSVLMTNVTYRGNLGPFQEKGRCGQKKQV